MPPAGRRDVLLTGPIGEAGREAIADIVAFTSVEESPDRAALLADVDRFEAIIYRPDELDADLLDRAESLRVIAKHCVGLDSVDVFEREPPAADHPLFGFENVVVTPRVAGTTTEASRARATRAAANAQHRLRGRRPRVDARPGRRRASATGAESKPVAPPCRGAWRHARRARRHSATRGW